MLSCEFCEISKNTFYFHQLYADFVSRDTLITVRSMFDEGYLVIQQASKDLTTISNTYQAAATNFTYSLFHFYYINRNGNDMDNNVSFG